MGDPDPFAGIETLVTVELSDKGDGTNVVVTHDRFPDAERRAVHDHRWHATLARLAGLLDEPSMLD